MPPPVSLAPPVYVTVLCADGAAFIALHPGLLPGAPFPSEEAAHGQAAAFAKAAREVAFGAQGIKSLRSWDRKVVHLEELTLSLFPEGRVGPPGLVGLFSRQSKELFSDMAKHFRGTGQWPPDGRRKRVRSGIPGLPARATL